jgi:serine/threonine-protein kinase
MAPQVVGRYRIEKRLGAGAMGAVYLAHDPDLDRPVAIKLLSHLDGDSKRRFQREARIIAGLRHPAIVPVYDGGDTGGQPYLVMAYLPGGSLDHHLHNPAGDTITHAQSFEVLRRVAQALDAAHAAGIVHRDVKPANVLFDEAGMAYLADFGIARPSEGLSLTSAAGTPRYMAPEQADPGAALTPAMDIYALGLLAFELFTGGLPLPGQLATSRFGERFDDVIRRCLEQHPAARWPTAIEFVDALAAGFSARSASVALAAQSPETDTAARDVESGLKTRSKGVLRAAAVFSIAAIAAAGAVALLALNVTGDDDDMDQTNGGGNGSPTGAPSPPLAASETVYAFVVDSSRSMEDAIAGQRKLDIARQSVLQTIAGLPAAAQVSLWSFGSSAFQSTDQSCADTKKLAGPASNQEVDFAAPLAGLMPSGTTPTTAALLNAGEDAIARGNAGTVVLVLLTDDRDKCGDLAARAVTQLQQRGLTVFLFIVALNVDGATREDFQAAVAVAEAGSGVTEVTNGNPAAVTLRLP